MCVCVGGGAIVRGHMSGAALVQGGLSYLPFGHTTQHTILLVISLWG